MRITLDLIFRSFLPVVEPQSLCPAAESNLPLHVEVEIPRISVSGWNEKEDFTRPEALQQEEEEEEEGTEESSAQGQYTHSAVQSHRAAPRDSGPSRAKEMTVLAKEEIKNVCAVDPSDSLSAEPSRKTVPDIETPLIKTLASDLPLINTGVNGFWRAEEESTSVKTEDEPSWSEDFETDNPLRSIPRNECINVSKLTHSSRESEAAESRCSELDTNSFDSSSFDDLFSSPEVARSLTAPHKDSTDRVEGIEERLPSSSFPFLSSFGNASALISDSVEVSSFSNSSDLRSRGLPSSTERAFSCPQCGRLFSSSRDLVVHHRSHGGERIYHCHLCKKPFIHPHQLKTHQRVHTGEKPFSCTQCGKRFSQSSHIKRHMSVHTGEKRYSCSLCGKRFSQACSLKVHQAVHTGERPYSCTKCGKSFSVLGNLVRHQSVHISK